MKKSTAAKILKTAKKLTKDGKSWHFHILSPGCILNKNKKFALVLEDTEKDSQLVYLTYKKPSKTGQKLVELLHGKGVSKASKTKHAATSKQLSANVKRMIDRAKELSIKGFSWHHHLLFPVCIFNTDSRYWTLVFEDTINSEVIKDMSKDEPKEALKQIEPLYYAQK